MLLFPFTRLRDESVEAARNSRQLQQEYLRLRREAQEAHAQADAAMRHAYRLERDALQTSSEAAARELATWVRSWFPDLSCLLA